MAISPSIQAFCILAQSLGSTLAETDATDPPAARKDGGRVFAGELMESDPSAMRVFKGGSCRRSRP